MRLALWLTIGLAAGLSAQAARAERIDLNAGWHFWRPASPSGECAARAVPDGALPVDVPHSWNVGTGAGHDGIGCYARRVVLSPALAAQHVELHFGGVFYKARIWVNGVEAGSHEGGFTAFDVDIGKLVRPGENLVVVSADNRPGFATIPGYAMRLTASGNVWYDWWRNGGIIRDVAMTLSDGGLIRRQEVVQQVGAGMASADARLLVENVDPRPHRYSIGWVLAGPDGKVAARAQSPLALGPGEGGAAQAVLKVASPQLWNVGAAKLYTLTAELRDADGRLLDLRSDAIGFRDIRIRDRRLYVNGAPVRLTGMTRHQDSPWEGQAETRGTVRMDWTDMASLHAGLTRPVHYPQPDMVYDEADRLGILLIPEIPIWQMSEAQLADPRLLALAKRMMGDMIDQARNHPSILGWSVMNESDASTPAGGHFFDEMKRFIKARDPGRFVTFADSQVSIRPWKRSETLAAADFIMANAYFGTWSGGADEVKPWLDFFDKAYPDKMLVISEFGWPGPFSADAAQADKARAANMLEQLDAFAARDFVAGAIFWTYQDYRSNKNLFPGESDGYVDHGLVDQYRQRKPSYAVWEKRNRPLNVETQWSFGDGGPDGFTASVVPARKGALPSYPLPGYSARWKALSLEGDMLGEGEAALDLSGPARIGGAWPAHAGDIRLVIDILTPAGIRAGGDHVYYHRLRAGSEAFPADPAQLPANRETP